LYTISPLSLSSFADLDDVVLKLLRRGGELWCRGVNLTAVLSFKKLDFCALWCVETAAVLSCWSHHTFWCKENAGTTRYKLSMCPVLIKLLSIPAILWPARAEVTCIMIVWSKIPTDLLTEPLVSWAVPTNQ
jgi:hypothetical protein